MDGKQKSYVGKQILAALLATIPSFTFGTEMAWFWTTIPLLLSHSESRETITVKDITWANATLSIAAICGIPFFSMASNIFGRKICIIFLSLLSCISWTIKLWAFKTFLLYTQAVAGLAAGGCLVVVPVYIKEISEDTARGALISLTTTMYYLGIIFFYAIDMLIYYRINNVICLSIVGLHIIVFCFMPESPSFLLKHRKEEKAAKAIAWLRSLKTNDEMVLDEITKLKEERREFGSKITIIDIFRDRPTFAALRMTLMLAAMKMLTGWTLLVYYSSLVFRNAGLEQSTSAVITIVLEFAGSFFTTTLIEKLGRKTPLASTSLIMALCMATLATCFLLDFNSNLLPVIAICVGKFAYGAGVAVIPTVIMAEVFNYEVRTILVGVSVAFSFLLSFLSSFFYPTLLSTMEKYILFYIFSAVILLMVIYTILWVPETKEKSLKQIEEFWQKTPKPTAASGD